MRIPGIALFLRYEEAKSMELIAAMKIVFGNDYPTPDAEQVLGWTARRSLEGMVTSAWKWAQTATRRRPAARRRSGGMTLDRARAQNTA
jgi:UDP-glucose 4-epimerase